MKTKHPLVIFQICVSVLLMASVAMADSITPTELERTIAVGESFTVTKTITLDPGGLTANKVDVFFLADNTGSMYGIIETVKTNAAAILDAISGGDSRFAGIDVGFGVGGYLGDPSEDGETPLTAYQLMQSITADKAATQAAINTWDASGGGDWEEANFFALQQVATNGADTPTSGVGTGQDTAWRDGAGKVIVWFGDAASHVTTISQAETIAALNAASVTVAAINTQSAGDGIDYLGQASAIAAATSGTLTNNVSGTDATIDAILAAVESATSSLNLTLDFVGDYSGLGLSFTPTSYLNVVRSATDALTYTFDLTITGITAGEYAFQTVVPGLGLVEFDRITVVDGAVPEPNTLLLVLAGITGLSYLSRRRARS